MKEMEASDYKRVTDVLYLGFVNGTLAALKRMLPRDRGTIIQIGSALSTALSPCSRHTAAANMRSMDLPTRCAASFPTTTAMQDHDSADACDEHDSVRLGKEPHAEQYAASPSNL